MVDRDLFVQAIRQSKNGIYVEFEKSDGSLRNMHVTLHPDVLPQRDETKKTITKKRDPDIQTVWDIDAKGFRSFKWSKVKNVVIPYDFDASPTNHSMEVNNVGMKMSGIDHGKK